MLLLLLLRRRMLIVLAVASPSLGGILFFGNNSISHGSHGLTTLRRGHSLMSSRRSLIVHEVNQMKCMLMMRGQTNHQTSRDRVESIQTRRQITIVTRWLGSTVEVLATLANSKAQSA